MKVGIVTIYNGQNCGGFMQAFAMNEYLKRLGYEAYFIKNNRAKDNTFIYRFFVAIKLALNGSPKKGYRLLKTFLDFQRIRKCFNVSNGYKNIPVCIYGSDTIWNMESPFYSKEWKHYWGKNYNGKKIAFAASCGQTAEKTVLENHELRECVKDFSHLGLRDENTYNIVKKIVNDKSIAEVIDPTMLLTSDFYSSVANTVKDKPYILFYCFERIENEILEEVRRYASEHKLELVTFGYAVRGCDKNLEYLPFDMMGRFEKAEFIITDTFHGCVFSLIFNKRFAVIKRNKAKVVNLLEKFGVSDRIINSREEFSAVVNKEVDFASVNKILEEKRHYSEEFLQNALQSCLGENK